MLPDDLPVFSNLTLEWDNRDGDDGLRQHQSPHRKTLPLRKVLGESDQSKTITDILVQDKASAWRNPEA